MAIGSGPGSFTGLRVGMSAMKGISLATKIKLLPIRSIDAVGLAGLEQFQTNSITVLLDGKQKDMFKVDYQLANDSLRIISDIVIKNYDELEELENRSIGNISKDFIKIKDYYDEFFPRAYYIGKIAYNNKEKEVEDINIEPQYYKDFKINKSKKVPLIKL